MELEDAILFECSAIETVEKLQKHINMSDANIMVLKKIMMGTSLAMGSYKKIEKEQTGWKKEISLLKNEYTTLQENHKKLLIDHWKIDREYRDVTKNYECLKEKYNSLLDKSNGQESLIKQMHNHVVDIETKIEGGKIELNLMKTKHKEELIQLKAENQKSSNRLTKNITANEKKICQLYDYILIFGDKATSGVGLSTGENRIYKNIRLQAKLFKSKLNFTVNEESIFEELDVDETHGPLSCASSIDTGLGSSVYTSDDEKYPSTATTPTRDSCASPLESSFILNLPILNSLMKTNTSDQHKKNYIDNTTSPQKLHTRSIALSPIKFCDTVIEKKHVSTATSPIKELQKDSSKQLELLDDIEDSVVTDILSRTKYPYKIISPIPFNDKVDTNHASTESTHVNNISQTKKPKSHFKPKLNIKKKSIHHFFSYFSNMTRKLVQKECNKILKSATIEDKLANDAIDSVTETQHSDNNKHVIILKNNNNESNQLTVPNKSGLFIINTAPGAVYHMSTIESAAPINKHCEKICFNDTVTSESTKHNGMCVSMSPSNNLQNNQHIQVGTNRSNDKKCRDKLSLISASKISIPANTTKKKYNSSLCKSKESSKSHHLFDDVGEIHEHKVKPKHIPSPEIEAIDINKHPKCERTIRNSFTSLNSSQDLIEKMVNESTGTNTPVSCRRLNSDHREEKNEESIDCCKRKKVNIVDERNINKDMPIETCGIRKYNRKRKMSDSFVPSSVATQQLASNQSATYLNIENDGTHVEQKNVENGLINGQSVNEVSVIKQKNSITECKVMVAPLINKSNFNSGHESLDVNKETDSECSEYTIKPGKRRVSLRNSEGECEKTKHLEVKNGVDEKLTEKKEFCRRVTRQMKPIVRSQIQNVCDSSPIKSPCQIDENACESNTDNHTDTTEEYTPALKRFKSNANEHFKHIAESHSLNIPPSTQVKTLNSINDQNKKNIAKAKLLIDNLNLIRSKPERPFIRKNVPQRIRKSTITETETLATVESVSEDSKCIRSEVSDLGVSDDTFSDLTVVDVNAEESVGNHQYVNNIWKKTSPPESPIKLAPDKNGQDFHIMILNRINDKKKKKKIIKHVVPHKIVITLENYVSTFTLETLDGFIDSISKEKEKHIGCAIVEFLCSENRVKDVLLNSWPILPMTQPQQFLICFMRRLSASPPPHYKEDLFELVMKGIEYKAFHLNNTPHLSALKNLAVFYTVLCRIKKQKDRLKLFCMDALYCLSFKAAPLVYCVLQSWPNLLPRASFSAAQDPLVLVMVHYLLSNFSTKCEYNSQQLKCLLNKKYGYETGKVTDDEVLKLLLEHIRDNKLAPYKDNITAAFLLLGKRCGVDWCHKNIIANSLLPIIGDHTESPWTRATATQLIGPLVRPFPAKMFLQCEVIAKKLSNMLKTRDDPLVEDAIVSSLTYFTKKNYNEMIGRILRWQPRCPLSEHTRNLLELIVSERTPTFWKAFLSRNSKNVDVDL